MTLASYSFLVLYKVLENSGHSLLLLPVSPQGTWAHLVAKINGSLSCEAKCNFAGAVNHDSVSSLICTEV